jgi:hypothetical protein
LVRNDTVSRAAFAIATRAAIGFPFTVMITGSGATSAVEAASGAVASPCSLIFIGNDRSTNPDTIAFLQTHGTTQRHQFRLFCALIVDAESAKAKVPRCHGMGTHGLAMARFDRWLARERFVDGLQNSCRLTSRQVAQIFLSRRCIF